MKTAKDIKSFEDWTALSEKEKKSITLEVKKQRKANAANHIKEEWGIFEKYGKLTEEEIDKKAKELVSKMTLEQKVNQMTANHTVADASQSLFKYNHTPYYSGEDKELGIPALKFSDGPTGVVMGNSSTCFPVSMGRASTWDPELETKVGNTIGIEARAQGANYYAGVCINLIHHPAWGRSQESYGEDPYLLGRMGSSLVNGVQNHIMACAKHFAGNSMENGRFKVSVEMDERTLREIYLPHFKACVDAGVASVMSAYNRFRGTLCSHNKHLLRDILKNEWGFKGFILSDFIWAIRDGKAAANAGMDIEMPCERFFGKNLVELVKKGEVDEKVIDEAAFRVLRTKIRFSQIGDKKLYVKENVASKEHIALARKVACESMVLLKNEKNLLPLNIDNITKIAVIGKLANQKNIGDSKGSSAVHPPYAVTPLEGIKARIGDEAEVIYDDGSDLERMKNVIKDADAVIAVVGLTCMDEGEFLTTAGGIGGDRDDLRLHEDERKLIDAAAEANKNCIVCVEGGSSIIMHPWNDKVSSILMAWYPGMEGGNALADIIFGDFNPCGKLPLTIPKSKDQLPFFDKDAEKANYGYYHGYFLADKNGYDVSYPFGFGLSYTTYEYSSIKVDNNTPSQDATINVSVDVKNTGSTAGDEVVEMYTGYVNPSVERHVKDLKGFTRVHLNPGETKTANIPLKVSDLAYYDDKADKWVVDNIKYVIYVGSSSNKNDLLTTTIEVNK